METFDNILCNFSSKLSSYRTYEEWKRTCFWWNRIWNRFLPYLWGMETVLHTILQLINIHSSYRTYEEWKLQISPSNVQDLKVLTVPMRNGNSLAITSAPLTTRPFLPYLWGMETRHFWYIKRCGWVLTVPMRNGNCTNIKYGITCR